jgi:hypothetical protein
MNVVVCQINYLDRGQGWSRREVKTPIQKAPMFQKGHFSITSNDGDLEVGDYFSILSLN